MDMLHNFSVPQLDHQDYGRDILTAEDHHNLSHLQATPGQTHPLVHPDAHNLSPDGHGHGHTLGTAAADAHNLASSTHNLSSTAPSTAQDWQSPTYSYTTSTPEDSPGVDDLSLGYEFDLVSPTYATPTLSALISPVRGGGF